MLISLKILMNGLHANVVSSFLLAFSYILTHYLFSLLPNLHLVGLSSYSNMATTEELQASLNRLARAIAVIEHKGRSNDDSVMCLGIPGSHEAHVIDNDPDDQLRSHGLPLTNNEYDRLLYQRLNENSAAFEGPARAPRSSYVSPCARAFARRCVQCSLYSGIAPLSSISGA